MARQSRHGVPVVFARWGWVSFPFAYFNFFKKFFWPLWCRTGLINRDARGDDDYFSSDLPDEKVADIWGKLGQPVLILPSEKDEWVSKEIDVVRLVNRWKSFCKPGIANELSGLIPGANHRVEDAAAQKWLAERVAGFLAEIDKR